MVPQSCHCQLVSGFGFQIAADLPGCRINAASAWKKIVPSARDVLVAAGSTINREEKSNVEQAPGR